MSRPAAPGSGPSLEALRARNEDAWTTAFGQLWSVALRPGKHPELRLTPQEAEEVASDALAALVDRIEHVGTLDELAALTATIAYRRAVSVARKKFAAKRQPESGIVSFGNEVDLEESMQRTFEIRLADVELRELTVLLHAALAELDHASYVLLQEKIGLGLSYEQLSARHQLPLGTVCAKVARGLKKVREHLQKNPELMKELHDHLR